MEVLPLVVLEGQPKQADQKLYAELHQKLLAFENSENDADKAFFAYHAQEFKNPEPLKALHNAQEIFLQTPSRSIYGEPVSLARLNNLTNLDFLTRSLNGNQGVVCFDNNLYFADQKSHKIEMINRNSKAIDYYTLLGKFVRKSEINECSFISVVDDETKQLVTSLTGQTFGGLSPEFRKLFESLSDALNPQKKDPEQPSADPDPTAPEVASVLETSPLASLTAGANSNSQNATPQKSVLPAKPSALQVQNNRDLYGGTNPIFKETFPNLFAGITPLLRQKLDSTKPLENVADKQTDLSEEGSKNQDFNLHQVFSEALKLFKRAGEDNSVAGVDRPKYVRKFIAACENIIQKEPSFFEGDLKPYLLAVKMIVAKSKLETVDTFFLVKHFQPFLGLDFGDIKVRPASERSKAAYVLQVKQASSRENIVCFHEALKILGIVPADQIIAGEKEVIIEVSKASDILKLAQYKVRGESGKEAATKAVWHATKELVDKDASLVTACKNGTQLISKQLESLTTDGQFDPKKAQERVKQWEIKIANRVEDVQTLTAEILGLKKRVTADSTKADMLMQEKRQVEGEIQQLEIKINALSPSTSKVETLSDTVLDPKAASYSLPKSGIVPSIITAWWAGKPLSEQLAEKKQDAAEKGLAIKSLFPQIMETEKTIAAKELERSKLEKSIAAEESYRNLGPITESEFNLLTTYISTWAKILENPDLWSALNAAIDKQNIQQVISIIQPLIGNVDSYLEHRGQWNPEKSKFSESVIGAINELVAAQCSAYMKHRAEPLCTHMADQTELGRLVIKLRFDTVQYGAEDSNFVKARSNAMVPTQYLNRYADLLKAILTHFNSLTVEYFDQYHLTLLNQLWGSWTLANDYTTKGDAGIRVPSKRPLSTIEEAPSLLERASELTEVVWQTAVALPVSALGKTKDIVGGAIYAGADRLWNWGRADSEILISSKYPAEEVVLDNSLKADQSYQAASPEAIPEIIKNPVIVGEEDPLDAFSNIQYLIDLVGLENQTQFLTPRALDEESGNSPFEKGDSDLRSCESRTKEVGDLRSLNPPAVPTTRCEQNNTSKSSPTISWIFLTVGVISAIAMAITLLIGYDTFMQPLLQFISQFVLEITGLDNFVTGSEILGAILLEIIPMIFIAIAAGDFLSGNVDAKRESITPDLPRDRETMSDPTISLPQDSSFNNLMQNDSVTDFSEKSDNPLSPDLGYK